jgi:hypothetical protein
VLDSTWSSNAIFWQFLSVFITICHHMKDVKTRRCQPYLNVWWTLMSSSETCIVWCGVRFNFREIHEGWWFIFLELSDQADNSSEYHRTKGAIFWNYISQHNLKFWHLSEIFLHSALFTLFTVYLESHVTKTTKRNSKTWKFWLSIRIS